MRVAADARPKDPSHYTVVGRPVPRKDIPGKMTGEFTYIQDVRVPGMLHGRVVRPYGVGAQLLSVDESGLKEIPGFVALVRRDNFLGVVAETEWGAIQAAAKLGSTLNPSGPDAGQAKWSAWNGLPAMDKIWETVRDAPGADDHQGQPRRDRARPRRGRAKARGDLPDAVSDARLDRSVLRHRRCEERPGDLLVRDPDAARGSAGDGAAARHPGRAHRAALVRGCGRLWPQRLRSRERRCGADVAGRRPAGPGAMDALGRARLGAEGAGNRPGPRGRPRCERPGHGVAAPHVDPDDGRYPPDRGTSSAASRISSAPPAAEGPTSPMPIPSPMPMSSATARDGSRC